MAHDQDPGYAMMAQAINQFREEIKQFREDVKDDFSQTRDELRTYLPREVYQADKEALDKRLSLIERARESARNAFYTAMASIAVSIILIVFNFQGGK